MRYTVSGALIDRIADAARVDDGDANFSPLVFHFGEFKKLSKKMKFFRLTLYK